MKKYYAVRERESQQWFYCGPLGHENHGTAKRPKYKQKTYIYPYPEHVSPFIQEHVIIDANTEEEAKWQISNLK